MLGVLLLLVVGAAGCYNNNTGETEIHGIAKFTLPAFPETGGHAVVVFSEMHYQPSYRVQEGPRLLPPPDSVPVTGKELRLTSAELRDVPVPQQVKGSYDAAQAGELFRVNCMVCHGESMKGDGAMESFLLKGPKPADLTGVTTQSSTDGEIFSFVSGGGRQGLAMTEIGKESQSPMPEFRLLLTEEERWSLVLYLRSQAGP